MAKIAYETKIGITPAIKTLHPKNILLKVSKYLLSCC